MLSMWDVPDIPKISIACSALEIPGISPMPSWDLLLLGASLELSRFHRKGIGLGKESQRSRC